MVLPRLLHPKHAVLLITLVFFEHHQAGADQLTNDSNIKQKSKLDFLEQYHVEAIDHRNGQNLLFHLKGVSKLLKDWDLPMHVQDAGLFHSVFGTETFDKQAVPDGDRPLVKEAIGREAEELTWIFGNMDRQEFYKHTKTFLREGRKDGFNLTCITQGNGDRAMSNKQATSKCELNISPEQIPFLAAMLSANTLEQAPREPNQEWFRNEVNWQLHLFRPILPQKACLDMEEYLGRLQQQNQQEL